METIEHDQNLVETIPENTVQQVEEKIEQDQNPTENLTEETLENTENQKEVKPEQDQNPSETPIEETQENTEQKEQETANTIIQTEKDSDVNTEHDYLYPITIEDFDPNYLYPEHPNANPDGGLNLINEEPTPIGSFIKKITKAIFKGKFNFSKIIPPAGACYNKTSQVALADTSNILSAYSKKAASITDNLERLKQITAAVIANLHVVDAETKGMIVQPTFPGEHLEGGFQDGTRFEAKHMSRDPPMNSIVIKGPNNSYKIEAESCLESEMVGMVTINHVKAKRTGKTEIVLHDGTTYQIVFPSLRLDNPMSKSKTEIYVNDVKSYIHDTTNNLIANLEVIEPEAKGWFSAKKVYNVHTRNQFKIFIIDRTKKAVVSQGSSNILSYVQFDNKLYWRVTDQFEKFDNRMEGMNLDEKSSINLDYIKLIEAKDFKAADRILTALDKASG